MLMINKEIVDRNEYEEQIKDFADKLDHEIEQLEMKRDDVKGSAQEKFSNQLNVLKRKRNDIEEQLRTVRNISDEKWDDIQKDIDKQVDETLKEVNEIYEGVQNGFSYLFEKVTR